MHNTESLWKLIISVGFTYYVVLDKIIECITKSFWFKVNHLLTYFLTYIYTYQEI